MRASKKAYDIIQEFEGCRLDAYQDSVGVWTIGYGHTKTAKKGMRIDRREANRLLLEDVARHAKGVASLLKVDVNQNQFDALVSFAFNLGVGALSKSTLLRKLNNGDAVGAAAEFSRWVYAGGKKLNGLVRRRDAERKLFES